MPELRLLIGLPASGKSEYAAKLIASISQSWVGINWDSMRKGRGMNLKKFNRKDEEAMQKDSFSLAETFGLMGRNIIVDNTNLSENTRNKWKGVAQRADMTYTEVRMGATLEECVARDAAREGFAQVGRAVIERMALFAGLIEFPNWQRYILVDLDSTLANCENRRKFIKDGCHDWDNFEAHTLEDDLILPIARLVKMLYVEGVFEVIIISGRQIDRAGKDSVTWLKQHGIPFKHIFMRQGGDNRPDDVIKQEILDRLPKDRIDYVLDDRNSVVAMWRRNGLTCLQVADGNF
jgi:predicted kinase